MRSLADPHCPQPEKLLFLSFSFFFYLETLPKLLSLVCSELREEKSMHWNKEKTLPALFKLHLTVKELYDSKVFVNLLVTRLRRILFLNLYCVVSLFATDYTIRIFPKHPWKTSTIVYDSNLIPGRFSLDVNLFRERTFSTGSGRLALKTQVALCYPQKLTVGVLKRCACPSTTHLAGIPTFHA